jgi:hypothetical protein
VAGERVIMEALEYLGLAGGDARATTPDLTPGGVAGDRGFDWDLQCELSGAIKDLSMSDAMHGFIAAELGKVYRTVDGSTWIRVLNLGFPYYWYGVHAFDRNTAIIIGFINNTGEGVARWTGDGGATWTDDIVIDPDDWLVGLARGPGGPHRRLVRQRLQLPARPPLRLRCRHQFLPLAGRRPELLLPLQHR